MVGDSAILLSSREKELGSLLNIYTTLLLVMKEKMPSNVSRIKFSVPCSGVTGPVKLCRFSLIYNGAGPQPAHLHHRIVILPNMLATA